MEIQTSLKEDLPKNQKSFLATEPAALCFSTAQSVPGLSSWPFLREKQSEESAQMEDTKCVRKEGPSLEAFYGNKKSGLGVECDDMEMMRQLKALKSSIFNEKDDPRVYRKIDSISRMENQKERKIQGVSNSTAILLSQIGKDHTAELTEARIIRQSGGKDRHSKVVTSKGLRDRRVRLSVRTAVQFYEVVDRLGYDQPSKAVEWLIKEAKSAIDELDCLPDLGLQNFNAVDRASGGNVSRIQKKPILDAADCWPTSLSSCNGSSNLKSTRMPAMIPTPEEGGFEIARMPESMNGHFASQGHKSFSEKQSDFSDPQDFSSIFKQAIDYWSSLRHETKNRAPTFASAEFQRKENAAANGTSAAACGGAVANLQYSQSDHSFFGALSDARHCSTPHCGQEEASQFNRVPSEEAMTCKSTSSSSMEAPQRSAVSLNFWQNMAYYASRNHKTPLSQGELPDRFHPSPLQLSIPDPSALRSSRFQTSIAVSPSSLSTGMSQFPPSFPRMPQALSSNTENVVQANANIAVPSEFPVRRSNIVSSPTVSSIKSVSDFDDKRSSNVALLQSMALLRPEVYDSGLPINVQGSSGDQITKISPLHQGFLLSSLLAGGCNSLDQEDLSLQGPAYAEQMFSSIRSPLANTDEEFASSSAFPPAYSSMGSLQSNQINPVQIGETSSRGISSRPGQRLPILPNATQHSHSTFLSSSLPIATRSYCIEHSEQDWIA